MSTFELSAFAPTRPVGPADRLRKEWADLMDQLLIEAMTIPDDDDLEEEKRHWMTRWESLTTRVQVVATKDVRKSHQLDFKYTFPEDVYATVADTQRKIDKWNLKLATPAASRPKSMAVVVGQPSVPAPESSASRRSIQSNARPVVEIQVRKDRPRMIPINRGVRQNDPPCDRCKSNLLGNSKCTGKRGAACSMCNAAKKKCSLLSRAVVAKAPGPSIIPIVNANENEGLEAAPQPIRTANGKRRVRDEGESKQDNEVLRKRLRGFESELLQLSNTAHDLSNKAHHLAVEIRQMGESLEIDGQQ